MSQLLSPLDCVFNSGLVTSKYYHRTLNVLRSKPRRTAINSAAGFERWRIIRIGDEASGDRLPS